jgi:hypothetical protein
MSSGIDDAVKGKEYGKQLRDDYTAHHYHRPSDEYDPSWNYEGALQDMQILFNIGDELASSDAYPQWKAGSEFKAIREKSK